MIFFIKGHSDMVGSGRGGGGGIDRTQGYIEDLFLVT